MDRASTGRAGEEAALAEYLRRGFRLIARNWRCRIGEIDLVVQRGPLLVICEVKASAAGWTGGGHAHVDAAKRRKLQALAEAFLASFPASWGSVRFDVASVSFPDGRARVHLFEDAF